MERTRRYSNTTYLVLCGLFAALCAICSFITIPLGFTPVPINLATLAVFLAGGILGKKYGTISLVVYVLLGAVGIPVFAGFKGGLGVLAGPTGGYIIGYIAAAFLVGFIVDTAISKLDKASFVKSLVINIIAMIIGLAVCYALGTAWFMISTGTGFGAAMVSCVIPFLPGDAMKIALAAILVAKLRPLLNK
jgi:biotin transport system substrate-specific component